MTPIQWKNKTLGKSYDTDKAYGPQCWDFFSFFNQDNNIPVSCYCSITGYVCDLWMLRETYGYSQYYDYIYEPQDLRDGDWVIWNKGSSSHPSSHIAMYFAPNIELGQNQGKSYVTEKTTDFNDMMGAFRWKGWFDLPLGQTDLTINDHSYRVYRQNPETEESVVLSAGLNELAPIKEFGQGVTCMAKAGGANYYQMKADQADPYGTTYGDLSSPIDDVFTEVPNQNSTLYFDLETGAYGDCTGVHINPEHNVYSPSVVYPKVGNYQYARMVGMDHVNTVSYYTFDIRFTDGTYALGTSFQQLTPKQIATDFRSLDIASIAFMDGGGSANFGCVVNGTFVYARDSGRELPSIRSIIRRRDLPPYTPPVIHNDPELETPSTNEDESMSENNGTVFVPTIQEGWTDPEPTLGRTLVERVASLLSVKSIVTIALTVCFIILSLRGTISSEQFMNIFTVCISFFFGYQFEKRKNQNGS